MMIRDSTSEAARERKMTVTSDDFQQVAKFDDEDAGSHRWPLEGLISTSTVVCCVLEWNS